MLQSPIFVWENILLVRRTYLKINVEVLPTSALMCWVVVDFFLLFWLVLIFADSCCSDFIKFLWIVGKPYLGKPSDMWALGVVLFTMLYGQFPFYDSNPQELFRKIKAAEFSIPR